MKFLASASEKFSHPGGCITLQQKIISACLKNILKANKQKKKKENPTNQKKARYVYRNWVMNEDHIYFVAH